MSTTTETPSRTRITFDLADELTPEEVEKFEAAAEEAGEEPTEFFLNRTLRIHHPHKAA